MTEQGVGTNRYAYANNDPVNKFDPNGNSAFSFIVGIAMLFVPGLQPVGAAAISAAVGMTEMMVAGADFGDALKSAVISFATSMAMIQMQKSGVLGGGRNQVVSRNDLSYGEGFTEVSQNQTIAEEIGSNTQWTTDTSTKIYTASGRRLDYDLSYTYLDTYGDTSFTLADIQSGFQWNSPENLQQIDIINEFKKFGPYNAQGGRIIGSSGVPARHNMGIIFTPNSNGIMKVTGGYSNLLRANGIARGFFPSTGAFSIYQEVVRLQLVLLSSAASPTVEPIF